MIIQGSPVENHPMPAPKLSVITITYKDPDGFAATIDSLRPLTRENFGRPWEFIVIDSSPSENAASVARLTEEGWPLVHIEAHPVGIYGSQNLGLEHAKGDYLWILNGGDLLKYPDTLATMLNCLDNDPQLDMVCAGMDRTRQRKYLYSESLRPGLLANLVGSCRLCHQAILYRRRVFDKVGNYSTHFKLGADYEHHFRCYIAGMNAKCIPEPLVEYDMDGVSNDHKKAFRELHDVHRSLRNRLGVGVVIGNEIVRGYFFARIILIRTFSESRLGPRLKPLWYRFKRWTGARRSQASA